MKNIIIFLVLISYSFESCVLRSLVQQREKLPKLKPVLEKSKKKVVYSKNDHLDFLSKGKVNPNDTLLLYLNNEIIASYSLEPQSKITVPLKESTWGENVIEAKFKTQSSPRKFSYKFTVLPELKPKELEFKVLGEYKHDTNDFTQGLIVEGDTIIESTGGYGTSVLKKYNYKTGRLYLEHKLPKEIFGEGITKFEDKIFLLTYKERKLFIFNSRDLKLLTQKVFFSEGWGATHNDIHLIVSDGSSNLYYLDPTSLEIIKTLKVFDNEGEVKKINELEYIKGEIYANIWLKDEIIVIDPTSGIVSKRINFKDLVKNYKKGILSENVLNGIAYDAENDYVLITGKRWPVLFKIKILDENVNYDTP